MGLFDFFKRGKKDDLTEGAQETNALDSVLEETADLPTEERHEDQDGTAEELCEMADRDESTEKVNFEDQQSTSCEVQTDQQELTEENGDDLSVSTLATEEAEKSETSQPISEEQDAISAWNIPTPQAPQEAEDPASEPMDQPTDEPKKKGLFTRLKEGLGKTRNSIRGSVDMVLGAFQKIDEDLFEELEEILIMADLGMENTEEIMEGLRRQVKQKHITDPQAVRSLLEEEIARLLTEGEEEETDLPVPSVVLVIGVNGVGKTTTIGKLAALWQKEGKSVLLAAADTFRAAAIDQLKIWGERNGVDVICHEENSDPAAVVFDAVHAAKNRGVDVLICDTAGRLHNKKNLMEELKKMDKVIDREYPGVHRETYLVLDATTGQNALQQAKVFQEAAHITGIILTKLDGTAKGGIVVAIKHALKIPVGYIGVGERVDDLQKFAAQAFAKALFGEE